jgi:hypothetical protein
MVPDIVGSGHMNARGGGRGYGKSREEIETIVYKWEWPERELKVRVCGI